MRLAIYGIGMRGKLFYEKVVKNTKFEIVYFVQTKVTEDSWNGYNVISAKNIKWTDFEYLVIATDLYYDEIVKYLESFGDVSNKVIKYDKFEEMMWEFTRNCVPYWSCRVSEDIVFVSNSDDVVIPKTMYDSGEVFSQHIIDAFFDLVKKYYGYNVGEKKGYFLDIGANIGTTSIYVKKRINSDLKVIGFELIKQNYDLFRCNCILNGVDDITTECLGLSDEKCIRKYNYGGRNSGGSRVKEICDVVDRDDENTAQMTTLDEYLLENSIEAESIDYIWMDTEGHESNIINGAMKMLIQKKIPLLQEYNPLDYIGQNTMEVYLANIKKVYGNFIYMSDYFRKDIKVYMVSELDQFTENMLKTGVKQADLFFF